MRTCNAVWVEDLRWDVLIEMAETDPGHAAVSVRVQFVLPKGAYATTVLGAAFDLTTERDADSPEVFEP